LSHDFHCVIRRYW